MTFGVLSLARKATFGTMWRQNYLGVGESLWPSAAAAAAPIALLFFLIGVRRLPGWKAVLVALGCGGAHRPVPVWRAGEGPGGFLSLRRGVRAVSGLPQSIAVVLAATGMPQSDESKLFRWTLRHSLVLTARSAALRWCTRT